MRLRQTTALVAASVGIALLSACSSSGSGDSTAAGSTPSTSPTAAAGSTIVDLASTTPTLSTLVKAVQAADLLSTLEAPGPYTVFAPTDEAFAKLPETVTTRLFLPCNKDALTKVLTYHVLASKVAAADITPGSVATVEGENVTLAVDGGTVKVNDATVTSADIAASNGVVHVIDSVLVPPSVDPAALKSVC